jgi:hypothetical protein
MAEKREPYKNEPHNFNYHLTGTAYRYCVHCGLVAMRNELSQWAIKQGCNYKDHPSYSSKLSITNPFK